MQKKGVAEVRMAQRVSCWTVKNEIRSVLSRMTAALYEEFSFLEM